MMLTAFDVGRIEGKYLPGGIRGQAREAIAEGADKQTTAFQVSPHFEPEQQNHEWKWSQMESKTSRKRGSSSRKWRENVSKYSLAVAIRSATSELSLSVETSARHKQ